MARLAVAVAVVIALAVGVWMLWPGEERGATTSEPLAASTTTSSPTTTEPAPTTTEDDHIVDTVEEAEEILRDIWFAWFEGIYNQDEDRIRTVVITEEMIEAARTQFTTMSFDQPPMSSGVVFDELRVLRSDSDCLALWSDSHVSFIEADPHRAGVDILRWDDGRWRLLSSWRYEADLWNSDCEAPLR